MTKFALASAIVACLPAAASAATTGTTIAVSANVAATCTVGAAPLSFGSYSGATLNQSTTISPNCSNGTPYWIAIDAGGGSGATTTVRKLTGSSGTLNYSVYTSNTYATAWGTTQGTDTVAGTGNGTTQTVTVYGRIPSGQSSAVGTGYTDTLNVTVNF